MDWPALKDNDVVVDVGGGVGDLTLLLAKAFPRLKFIMQDQKTVIPEAEKVVSDLLTFVLSMATDLHEWLTSFGKKKLQS